MKRVKKHYRLDVTKRSSEQAKVWFAQCHSACVTAFASTPLGARRIAAKVSGGKTADFVVIGG